MANETSSDSSGAAAAAPVVKITQPGVAFPRFSGEVGGGSYHDFECRAPIGLQSYEDGEGLKKKVEERVLYNGIGPAPAAFSAKQPGKFRRRKRSPLRDWPLVRVETSVRKTHAVAVATGAVWRG
jgi:hypothetical protein